MYIATSIYNRSLWCACLFDHFEDALNEARDMAERILGRSLTEDEHFSLENENELLIDLDQDNEYTVSIAAAE